MEDIDTKDLWDGKQSPTVSALKHYICNTLGMGDWDNKKVKRICDYIGVTLDELCALAGIFHPHEIEKRVRLNRWTVTHALHWERIYRVVASVRLKQPLEPTPADVAIARFLDEKEPLRPSVGADVYNQDD